MAMKKLLILDSFNAFVLIAMLVGGSQVNKKEFESLCEIIKHLKFTEGLKQDAFAGVDNPIFKEAVKNITEAETLVKGEQIAVSGEASTEQATKISDGNPKPVNATTPFGDYMREVALQAIGEIRWKVEQKGGIKDQLSSAASAARDALQTAQTAGKNALCGAGKDCTSTVDAQTFYTTPSTAVTTYAGKTLANDVAWLCISQSTSTNECVSTGTTAQKVGNAGNAKTRYDELLKHCQKPEINTTHDAIEIALSRFFGLLGKQITVDAGSGLVKKQMNNVLGKLDLGNSNGNQDCDGTNADRVCLNYGPAMAGNKEIEWVVQVKGVAKQWKIIGNEEKIIKGLLKEVRRLQDEAWLAYRRAKLGENVNLAAGNSKRAAPSAESGQITATRGAKIIDDQLAAAKELTTSQFSLAAPAELLIGLLF